MPEPTTDFAVFDHQELVNWVTAGGPINGIRAVQRPLTQTVGRRIEQFVSLVATDVVFHLDGAPLAAATLAVDDSLETSDGTYVVIFFEWQSFETTILAVCRIP
jgi:hypothetical protein